MCIYLNIDKSYFKDNRLSNGWYKEDCLINHLKLVGNDIVAIEENAFNVPAFKKLKGLILWEKLSQTLQWEHNSLNGLPALLELFVTAGHISMAKNALKPVRQSVTRMGLMHLMNDISFNDLFGVNADRLDFLYEFSIKYATPVATHTLTKSNLTSLGAISSIDFSDCGIASLETGLFDRFAGTLRNIVLHGNKLTTLPPRIFNRLIDLIPDDAVAYKNLRVSLSANPFICNCDFYETFGHLILPTYMQAILYVFQTKCINLAMPLVCPQLQYLNPYKFQPSLFPPEVLVYSKFILKIDVARQELIIRTAVADRFRVWLQVGNDFEFDDASTSCPNSVRLKAQVYCVYLQKNETKVSIARFAIQKTITMVCISYISSYYRRFWPLHCISVYWPVEMETMPNAETVSPLWDPSDSPFITLLVISAIGLIIGCLINCIGLRCFWNGHRESTYNEG